MTKEKRPEDFRTLIEVALEDFPTVFDVACDILNGDVRLPPESPELREHASRPLPPRPVRGRRWGGRLGLADREIQAIIEEAGLAVPPERPRTQREMADEKEREWYWHHPTDKDMKAAGAAVASLLRYFTPPPRGLPASYKRGSQKLDCFANYALPGVAKWPPEPRLDDAELIAALKVLLPERKRVLRLVAGLNKWAVAYTIRILAVGLEIEPRSLREYYRCLVAAFTLRGWEGVDREVRPCLACPRFFVARSAKRLTCSDACRQRYSRYTRDDWKEASEKDRLRKATSAKSSFPKLRPSRRRSV